MSNYIITSEPTEHFNAKGESLGMSDKRAVFYSPSIGRRRYYRQSISTHPKGLRLLAFKTEKKAQQVCDCVSQFSGGEWKVESLPIDCVDRNDGKLDMAKESYENKELGSYSANRIIEMYKQHDKIDAAIQWCDEKLSSDFLPTLSYPAALSEMKQFLQTLKNK